MPQILAFGTVGTSQWRYLAQRMEEALADLAASKAVTRQALPTRLLEAAREFFTNALNAHSGAGNDDPSVSIANYRLAAQALRSSRPTIAQESREKLIKTLEDYANLLDSFAKERPLSGDDLHDVDELKSFFQQLFVANRESRCEMEKRKCLRCGAEWLPRIKRSPVQCPRCKSVGWNRPRPPED